MPLGVDHYVNNVFEGAEFLVLLIRTQELICQSIGYLIIQLENSIKCIVCNKTIFECVFKQMTNEQ